MSGEHEERPVEDNPLEGVTLEGGVFVFDGAEGGSPVEESRASKERFHRAVDRLIGPEKLGRFIAWFYGRVGRKYDLKALQVDKDSADFRDACEYLYEDLKGGIFGPVIDHLPVETLDRVLVYYLGFGAPVKAAWDEAKARGGAVETGFDDKMEDVRDGDA